MTRMVLFAGLTIGFAVGLTSLPDLAPAFAPALRTGQVQFAAR